MRIIYIYTVDLGGGCFFPIYKCGGEEKIDQTGQGGLENPWDGWGLKNSWNELGGVKSKKIGVSRTDLIWGKIRKKCWRVELGQKWLGVSIGVWRGKIV